MPERASHYVVAVAQHTNTRYIVEVSDSVVRGRADEAITGTNLTADTDVPASPCDSPRIIGRSIVPQAAYHDVVAIAQRCDTGTVVAAVTNVIIYLRANKAIVGADKSSDAAGSAPPGYGPCTCRRSVSPRGTRHDVIAIAEGYDAGVVFAVAADGIIDVGSY